LTLKYQKIQTALLGALAVALLLFVAACGDSVALDRRVRGQVRGLWTGAEPVVLRLEAGHVDTQLSVAANGAFEFTESVSEGESYRVAIVTSPARHACVVDAAGNGTVANADIMNVSVACTGPAVTIELSEPWGPRVDPTRETQRFQASVFASEVAFTIAGGDLETAQVDGAQVLLGETTPPISLPLGETSVPIAVVAAGGLSRTYELVFDRGAAVLAQIAYGKASNTSGIANLGVSLALSDDTLVVGAMLEASSATGINGDQTDRSAPSAGAVYVFVRDGVTWSQQAYLKASNTEQDDIFGYSVAISGDSVAVGAIGEDSGLAGVDPPDGQADNRSGGAGAVYVFVRAGTTWSQQAYLKASNPGPLDRFGYSVALSGDTLAISAFGEASSATGINGEQADNSASASGAVYVLVRDGATWTQQVYIKASNANAFDEFGAALALSGDTLVVGAPNESSKATGVDGDQADNSELASGAGYVFTRTGTTWSQQAYLKASNAGSRDFLGRAVALSGDTAVIGAPSEASSATGANPPAGAADNSAAGAGAAYVFVRRGRTWTQQAYIKASNTEASDQFGTSLAVFEDTLAVGAIRESSAATGINGDQTNNRADGAGAVYVLIRRDTAWAQHAYLKASNTGGRDAFGSAIALSVGTLVTGAPSESSGAVGVNALNGEGDNSAFGAGAVYIFR
jgi:FG-GAP repeat